MLSLIRPSATFSRAKGGRRQRKQTAFSRFFQREKVPEGRMREDMQLLLPMARLMAVPSRFGKKAACGELQAH
jgi:hypothetical protein